MQNIVNEMSLLVSSIVSESSAGLFRINENIIRKVPILVQEKDRVSKLNSKLVLINSDVREIQSLVNDMKRINSFTRILNKLIASCSVFRIPFFKHT